MKISCFMAFFAPKTDIFRNFAAEITFYKQYQDINSQIINKTRCFATYQQLQETFSSSMR